jgi:hypothetical protein
LILVFLFEFLKGKEKFLLFFFFRSALRDRMTKTFELSWEKLLFLHKNKEIAGSKQTKAAEKRMKKV